MKISPNSLQHPRDPELLQPTQLGDMGEESEKAEYSEEEETNSSFSPYEIEITLEKLDHEDRKWLLFQLVLCNPIFLEEVMLGFPLSLLDGDDIARRDRSGDGDDVGVINSGHGSRGKLERAASSTIDEGNQGTCPSGNIFDVTETPSHDLNYLTLEAKEGVRGLIYEKGVPGEGKKKGEDVTGQEKEADQPFTKSPRREVLLPIIVPHSEWVLTYSQIDAIPSETRDEFLLNLFLMSPTHSSILESFCSSLGSGRANHAAYNTYPDMKKWKKSFRRANEGRKVVAKAEMEKKYGSVRSWEEFGDGREGVWDVALCELAGWLMRDMPCPNEAEGDKSSEAEHVMESQTDTTADQDGGSKSDESATSYTPQCYLCQDYIKMMAFIIQTKTLSLVQKIARPDSASDSWPGRSRYIALTINDMVKLLVLFTRCPLSLRILLHSEIIHMSAEIEVLFHELGGVEYEWFRFDDGLAWDIACIQRGLNDVGYGDRWSGVMDAWREKRGV